MKKIIALAGIKRSGKDSVAAILDKQGYTHFKFADYLAKLVTEVVGKNIAAIYSQDNLKEISIVGFGKSWRELMIEIGARERAKDPKVFVKKTIEAINQCDNDLIVISDVRMINEIEGLREAFPAEFQVPLIWIDRKGCDINLDIPTENGECKPLADIVISNDAGLVELARTVECALNVVDARSNHLIQVQS